VRAEVEGDRPLGLQLGVDRGRLGEELVDPRRGLAEEEAAVSPGRSRADPGPLDDEDALAALGEEARERAAGEAGARDDDVGRPSQPGVGSSSSPERRRQKRSAPPTAASAATIAAVFGARDPSRVPGAAPRTFRATTRLTIGFAAV
jgi:hypothetical protein